MADKEDDKLPLSPAEQAAEIAEDNSIEDGVAIRKLIVLMIQTQEDCVIALWDMQKQLGLTPDTVKH